jgi:hypothetical protein
VEPGAGAGTGTTVVSFFSHAPRPSAISTTAAETASFGLVMTPPVQKTNTFSIGCGCGCDPLK